MNADDTIFAQDGRFWLDYLRGRPRAPDSFFDRIFDYHAQHGGVFGTVHDVGAGIAPYAERLRTRFDHVIVSDIAPENVDLARQRLQGQPGFTFRVASLDTERGQAGAQEAAPSVDLVFATNVMHFADDQAAAMAHLAAQLRPGGTFAAALFGPARFMDPPQLQPLWDRISRRGGAALLRVADHPEQTARIMARTQDTYNVAPLSPALFQPGALRVHLHMGAGGIQGLLPDDVQQKQTIREPCYTGPDDVELFVDDEPGWDFATDQAGLKAHFASFPFISQFPDEFVDLYAELDQLVGSQTVHGYFPAKIILATRR